MCVGAFATQSSPTAAVMACGDRSEITEETSSTSEATFNNGAYWYFYEYYSSYYSFGFAPDDAISLSSSAHYGDTYSSSCEQRLSWITSGSYGGYRAGCDTSLYDDSTRYKVS